MKRPLSLQLTDICAFGGIQTRNPSKRAAADMPFRPRNHWDWRNIKLPGKINTQMGASWVTDKQATLAKLNAL
jgi:hypothetical protein